MVWCKDGPFNGGLSNLARGINFTGPYNQAILFFQEDCIYIFLLVVFSSELTIFK